MRMPMRVLLDDPETTLEVVCDARDFREWEAYAMSRRPPLPVKIGADNMPQTTWLTRMAFTAARRSGQVPDDWGSFDARCFGVEPVEEPGEVTPEGGEVLETGVDPTLLAPTPT